MEGIVLPTCSDVPALWHCHLPPSFQTLCVLHSRHACLPRLAPAPAVAGLVEVRRPQWVSGARATPQGWQVRGKRGDEGLFDAVIIAHNGKCANRLTAPMGVPDLHSQLRRLKLSANWVLMVAFNSPVPVPGGLEGAFITGSPVLSWAANQTAKLGPAGAASNGSSGSSLECWTLISTQAYGRGNKVPQVRRGQAKQTRGCCCSCFRCCCRRRCCGCTFAAEAVAGTRTKPNPLALPARCLYAPLACRRMCLPRLLSG